LEQKTWPQFRAQISAIGRKFRKEVWPIELKEHFFKISSTSISNRYGIFGQEQIAKKTYNVAIEDPGIQVFKT
jgi:hypothetical protein